MEKKWISKAIKKPGALREYVKRKYGKKGFDKDGKIKYSILLQLRKSKNQTIRKRANLALLLRKMNK